MISKGGGTNMPKTGRENRSHVATRLGAACVSGCLLLAAVTGALQRLSSAADGGSVAALDVVFNEIAWMGTGADYRDEWIELHNNTTHDIDLSGWSIAAEVANSRERLSSFTHIRTPFHSILGRFSESADSRPWARGTA